MRNCTLGATWEGWMGDRSVASMSAPGWASANSRAQSPVPVPMSRMRYGWGVVGVLVGVDWGRGVRLVGGEIGAKKRRLPRRELRIRCCSSRRSISGESLGKMYAGGC
jgi:hypothetical protein